METFESSISIHEINLRAAYRPTKCLGKQPTVIYTGKGIYDTGFKGASNMVNLLGDDSVGLVFSYVPAFPKNSIKPCRLLHRIKKKMHEQAFVFLICDPQNVGHLFVQVEQTGFRVRRMFRTIVWEKQYREMVTFAATLGGPLPSAIKKLPDLLYFGTSCNTEKRIIQESTGIVADIYCNAPHVGLATKYLGRPYLACTQNHDAAVALEESLNLQETQCLA